jgi:hypothetical protein
MWPVGLMHTLDKEEERWKKLRRSRNVGAGMNETKE